jgi:hypothetical protein
VKTGLFFHILQRILGIDFENLTQKGAFNIFDENFPILQPEIY